MRSLSTTFPANGLIEKINVKRYKFAENAFLPKIVTVPLVQGNGCVCKSLVKKGDVVEEGDVIGVCSSDEGKDTKIHSPVPGTVIDVIPCQISTGKIEHAVQIKLEGKFSYLGKKREKLDWKNISSENLIDTFYEKGLVNTFNIAKVECLGPQIDKILKQNSEKKSLIVRLFDEDPSRCTDSLISQFYFDKVRTASLICAKALNTKNILYLVSNSIETEEIARTLKISEFLSKLKNSDKETIKNSQKKDKKTKNNSEEKEINDNDSDFKEEYVIISQKKYPYSLPSEVVSSVNKPFRKTIGFNISKEDLFIDSSSLLQVYDAVVYGIPSLSKFINFTGDCLGVSCFLQVRIGTRLSDVVNQLGKFNKTPKQIIINGAISGTEISSLDVPLTKDVKSVIFNSRYNNFDLNIFPCINCGNCRNVCPVRISPDILYNSLTMKYKISELQYKSSLLCTDCGLCNTVCPSRLPLSQSMKIMAEKNKNGEQL